ncbi:hypothetical protein P171DRAFT_351116 [Karstenula rhodostoma CBS 690.94]|uniref:Fe2OG dioxygenase domain-containing protein n=1 Tax=Karstenula rhodostoma CBS 690.94 TaxID=1392251 RepID=A0A9P4PUH7_9PLEO|nr:hypothetical protein P171DRAFT_351116 [Karstenula rhodostoma CBS 690.94]
MISLLELVTQNQPHFQTHQALLVLGLQNDFILPDGKLPVNTRNGFLDRIHALIPTFRKQSSNIIWTKTLYETDRLASDPTTGEGDAVVVGGLVDGVESSTDDDDDLPKDLIRPTQSRSSTSKHRLRALNLLKRVSARKSTSATPREELQAVVEEDEELFLRQSAKNGPACLPGTPGAEFSDAVKSKIESSDTVVQTTNYSAFQGTSLLLILRARLVTEVYICGCITNVNVLATVIDAARHGIRINVVGDCLGFRKQSRHKIALKRMVEFFDANIVTSQDVINRNMPGCALPSTPQKDPKDEQGLQDMVENLRVSGTRITDRPTESRAASDTKLSDEQFAERLVQGAKTSKADRQPEKQSLVKSKIRMRPRTFKDKDKDIDKKSEEKRPKGELSRKGGTSDPEARLLHAAEREPEKRAKTPHAAPSEEKERPASLAKAGSSDKLQHSISKSERSLKPSASQPALSFSNPDKDITSRVRMALTRAPKTESNEELPVRLPTSTAEKASAVARSTTSSEPTAPKASKLQSLATFPVLGPDDRIAEGDSRIIYDFFAPELYHPSDRSKPLREIIFTQIYNEVRWQTMHHQQGEVPRLVCAQGEFSADGSMPIYRHPADQTLPLLHFSPKVHLIRKRAEKLAGHPLNHVLVQLYRAGTDYISEHSDKSLDIARGSSIVNVSFGAQRTMRLRTKKPDKVDDSQRETQRVAMPHNSMFVLGLESNAKWLHGIMADKRMASERSDAENAYEGMRISLTFRHIATYLDAKCHTIWGQGATMKEQRDAADVINDDKEENERLVRAFSRENHAPDFDWAHWYGDGYDVLHFQGSPKDLPIVFASNNQVENNMVKVYLAERNVEYSLIEAPIVSSQREVDRQVGFRDNDLHRTEVTSSVIIIAYLERFYTNDTDERNRPGMAASYDILIMMTGLLKHWYNRHVPTYPHSFIDALEILEERYAFSPGQFISGRRFAYSDCIAWVVLDELIRNWDGWSEEGFPGLTGYYRMVWKKKMCVQTFRPELPDMKKFKPTTGERAEE